MNNYVTCLLDRYGDKVVNHKQNGDRYIINLRDGRSIHVIDHNEEIYAVMYKHMMTLNMTKHGDDVDRYFGLADDFQ